MSAWELPSSLQVGGLEWKIRTDFRAVLDILKYFSDPDYREECSEICLDILYENFANMPPHLWQEALEKAIDFIDMGIKGDKKHCPHTMDWEKDAPVIIPAVNRILKSEIRSTQELHWWTFLGAYMEIQEGLFSQIVSIRLKMAKGKKLEKWEADFYRENKELIDLQEKKEKRSDEETKALRDYFGYKGR